MSDSKRLATKRARKPRARMNGVYTRTVTDDEAGTACRDQVGQALDLLEFPARAAVYADAAESGLDADRPALRRLLADARRGCLRCAVVRDLARLARSAALLETILDELRTAGVELVTAGRTDWRA